MKTDEGRQIRNAVIESASITTKDRGLLDCWLTLDYGGEGQGFGGYALYLPKSFSHYSVKSVDGHHIYRIMEVAGVELWDSVVGRTIRVDCSHGKVHGIGHIIKEDWFYPAKDYEQLGKEVAA